MDKPGRAPRTLAALGMMQTGAVTASRNWSRATLLALAAVVLVVGIVVLARRVGSGGDASTCRPLLVVEVTAGDESAFQRTFLGREGEAMSEVDGQSRLDRASLSPDGTELVAAVATDGMFDRNGDPAAELWVLDLKGALVRRLADSTHGVRNPEWSPDGQTVLFAQRADGEDPVIALVSSDGGGEARTVETPGRVWSPTWSLDGGTIAYLADAAPFSEQTMVATVSADGTGHKVIAQDRPLVSSVSYSPDATSLVINRIHKEPFGISLVDVATGVETLLVAEPHTWSPSWSSDGRSLYWVHDEEIWTGRFDGERLVDQRQVELRGLDLDGGYLSHLDVGPC